MSARADYLGVRFTEVLRKDPRDLAEPYAQFWIGLMRRHSVAMPIVDLLVYVLLVSLAWVFLGTEAGVVALAITLGLYGWGIARVLRRRSGRG